MKQIWFRTALVSLLFVAPIYGQSRQTLVNQVSEGSGWKPSAPGRDYDETNLEQLSARLAPVVKRYGVTGVTTQDWTGPGGNTRSTLYEMTDAAAAYGLFTWQRNPDDPSYSPFAAGAEGFRTSNGAVFWQSKYVVTMTGATAAVEDLGRAISQNILGQSRKPPVSEHLPPNRLIEGTEKYILHADDIDQRALPGIDTAALGFEDSVEIATARYDVNGRRANLLLMLYPTQQVAKKYADALPMTGTNGPLFQKRVAALVAVMSGVKDAAAADVVFADVNYESKVTWNERRPGLALGTMIVTIFTFIGVALLFTLVAGISFGGFRIFVKARYPNRVFDRPEDMEIIQLKLIQGVTRRELSE
jgi:hypothetical protein